MTSKKLLFIALSILLSMLLAIMPLPEWALWWRPAWILLLLLYWVLAIPNYFSLGICWCVGIVTDLLLGTVVGEHALAFVVCAYIAMKLHRQVRMFPLLQQTGFVLLLVLFYQLILFLIQGITGDVIRAWQYWAVPLTSAIFWPWLFSVLNHYQRRLRIR